MTEKCYGLLDLKLDVDEKRTIAHRSTCSFESQFLYSKKEQVVKVIFQHIDMRLWLSQRFPEALDFQSISMNQYQYLSIFKNLVLTVVQQF